jgi:DNA-directed RNA polymerase subunit N (RpoN/RPB10)
MLYSTCPSCGYFLGQKILEWESKSNEICNNPKLSLEEKETKKQELLLSLNLRRYCCKMRIMTYKDIVQDILPIPNEN